jgi:hypothetical protein
LGFWVAGLEGADAFALVFREQEAFYGRVFDIFRSKIFAAVIELARRS